MTGERGGMKEEGKSSEARRVKHEERRGEKAVRSERDENENENESVERKEKERGRAYSDTGERRGTIRLEGRWDVR